MTHLLILLYFYMPPLRGGDLGDIYVVQPDSPRATLPGVELPSYKARKILPELRAKNGCIYCLKDDHVTRACDLAKNVLVIEGEGKLTLKLREYKTDRRGTMISRLHEPKYAGLVDPELIKVIGESLKQAPREKLFVYASEHAFNVWADRVFQKVFQKPVTANTLRHMFVTNHDAKNPTHNGERRMRTVDMSQR
jgi:hypothetical protein